MMFASRASTVGGSVIAVPPIIAYGESLLRIVLPSKLRNVSPGASVRVGVIVISGTSATEVNTPGAPIATLLPPSTRITAASGPIIIGELAFGPIETLLTPEPKATVMPVATR